MLTTVGPPNASAVFTIAFGAETITSPTVGLTAMLVPAVTELTPPAGPIGPVSPFIPCSPRSPCPPTGPCSPVGPITPCGPIGPIGPCSP